MTAHSGQCHCGALRVEFSTDRPLRPRACQCSFCRKQHARMVSDPAGAVVLSLGGDVARYRFGTQTTDFILCGRCGIYVGAIADIDGRTYATLNLNAFDDPKLDLPATPISYEGEDARSRADRRRQKWTPARIIAA